MASAERVRALPSGRFHLDSRATFARSGNTATKAADRKESTMLWTILVILVVLWLLGLIGSIGGSAIHLLLVLAAIVLIAQLVSGRRTV
jgi:hypothetical protein